MVILCHKTKFTNKLFSSVQNSCLLSPLSQYSKTSVERETVLILHCSFPGLAPLKLGWNLTSLRIKGLRDYLISWGEVDWCVGWENKETLLNGHCLQVIKWCGCFVGLSSLSLSLCLCCSLSDFLSLSFSPLWGDVSLTQPCDVGNALPPVYAPRSFQPPAFSTKITFFLDGSHLKPPLHWLLPE